MDRINFFKFMLLALALPTQYFLSQYWANDNTQQSIALTNLVDSLYKFKSNYLEFESWKKWYISLVLDIPAAYKGPKVYFRKNSQKEKETKKFDYDDDIAIEVFTYRKHLTNFGESSIVRTPRPSKVLYRVGQVVKHKRFDLTGVIIGWDPQAIAPENWLERNYDENEKENFVNQPHYLLLVDEKYQDKYTGKAYVAQNDIEIVVNNKIKHRVLNSYFSNFDGGQYLKKKYLQTVYPHD